MVQHANCPSRSLFTVLLLAASLLATTGTRATAQIDPSWDHYKVYDVQPPISYGGLVTLSDQFGTSTHAIYYLERFANPVEKDHAGVQYPINHPELHYSWWKISDLPFDADIIASNQFGDHPLHVGTIRYLLNPANKNAPAGAPLPDANHYRVYDCSGLPIDAPLFLLDQFYGRPAQHLVPRYFCVPTVKQTPNGAVYPILDEKQHYVVYEIEPGTPIWSATISDQFIRDQQIQMFNDRWLMVPTLKHFPPTGAKTSTWGRVKQLFR